MKKFLGIVKLKKVWIPALVIIILIGLKIASPQKSAYTVAYTVASQDIRESVLATGTVTSQSNLNLSFKNGGVLSKLNVNVGDKVRKGQTLAMLDQRDATAAINQASASLLAAKANYQKVVNGASSAEVQVAQAAVSAAQVNLDNAKRAYDATVAQQKTAVSNAQSAMYNAGLAAVSSAGNGSTATVTVSGTYTDAEPGQYKVTLVSTGSGYYYSVSGLETYYAPLNRGVPLLMGARGLSINFSSTGNLGGGDFWTIDVPNAQSSTYLAAYNAYQAALQTQTQAVTAAQGTIDSAQAALDQANAQLALKQSAARPEDVQAAQAQVQSAQAQLQTAQNQYSNNTITSPIDGIVTSVDLKLGENVPPQSAVIVVLDQTSLHVESNISESSISLVKQGQGIDMTMDAFGPDRHFSGEVLSIDPASTVVQGVINYRVVSSIPTDADIKPGMTVNLTILVDERDNVLAIPNRLIKSSGDKKTITILKDGKPIDVTVTIGLVGDTMTEIKSGIQSGDKIGTTAAQ